MNEIMGNFSTLTDFIPLALIIICVNFATNFEVEKKTWELKHTEALIGLYFFRS